QQRGYLFRGMTRDGNDSIGAASRISGKSRESRSKLGRGVFAGHDKQVVKSRNGPPKPVAGQSLVQAVKQLRATRQENNERASHQSTGGIRSRPRPAQRSEKAIGPIAQDEFRFRSCRRHLFD